MGHASLCSEAPHCRALSERRGPEFTCAPSQCVCVHISDLFFLGSMRGNFFLVSFQSVQFSEINTV